MGKLKNRRRISESFRRNSIFHVSVNTRFWDIVQAMRNCRAGKRLLKFWFFILVFTDMSAPTPPHFRSVRKIAKMRKATVSCIKPVRLSISPHWTTRPHWSDFNEIRYLNIFRKFVEKIQVSLKYDKNYVYCTSRYIQTYDNISLDYS